MGADAEILFERRGRAGLITLNRPAALNALTLDMVRAMHAQLDAWAGDDSVDRVVIEGAGERAFCAGGDIRALYEWGREGDRRFLDFYREEYLLNTAVKRFPKPYVAIIDGIAMGGGVGVSIHGSHRIATERLTFAMPETGIGLFPDVGGTWFLARCPGSLGLYLGLTGARLKTADAAYAGLVDRQIPAERLGRLRDALCEAAPEQLDAVIGDLCQERDPADAPLAAVREEIDDAFGAETLDGVLQRLEAMPGDWASETLRTLATKSPTSLRIADRQIRAGATLDFESCMALEFRIVNRIRTGHDFYEGVRAVVIDKDQAPRWRPERLADVDAAAVEAYFAPLDEELPVDHRLS